MKADTHDPPIKMHAMITSHALCAFVHADDDMVRPHIRCCSLIPYVGVLWAKTHIIQDLLYVIAPGHTHTAVAI